MRTALGNALRGMLIVAAITSSASAVDGVLQINQACASGPGCFAGDTAGFPVQILARGSYRLTTDLTPPSQSTNVIVRAGTTSGLTIGRASIDAAVLSTVVLPLASVAVTSSS